MWVAKEVSHCTRKKLLTGVDGPLDLDEFYGWAAYRKFMHDAEEAEIERIKNEGKR